MLPLFLHVGLWLDVLPVLTTAQPIDMAAASILHGLMCHVSSWSSRELCVGTTAEERFLVQTYVHNQGTDLRSIRMLSLQVMSPDNVTANSTANPGASQSSGGGGIDLATIGKGIGAVPL